MYNNSIFYGMISLGSYRIMPISALWSMFSSNDIFQFFFFPFIPFNLQPKPSYDQRFRVLIFHEPLLARVQILVSHALYSY